LGRFGENIFDKWRQHGTSITEERALGNSALLLRTAGKMRPRSAWRQQGGYTTRRP
jgi:hypothetical protein